MGTRVKALRLQKGLSCEEMAISIGVTKATYSKKENGSVKFSLIEARIISNIFDKTIEEIFFKTEVA